MIKKYLSAVALASVLIAGSAFAQVIPVPQVQKLGQTDLTNVIPGGAPGAQSVYVPVGGIGGLFQYSYQVPLTAFALTVPNFVSFEYLNPAGTLATGTLTMSASPSDGQNFCLQDTQTQTAITISANTEIGRAHV